MSDTSPWRLAELVERAREAMDEELHQGDSKRVRWNPNPRLVRYYTTLGLLDGPSRMEGRTAYYGRRHLLQLLAVKSLQAQGLSLEEVQQRLYGLDSGELQTLAGLPDDWQPADLPAAAVEPAQEAPSSELNFWQQMPDTPNWEVARPAPAASFAFDGLELHPGVVLLIDQRRHGHLDPVELRKRAQSLLDYLEEGRDCE